MVDLVDTDNYLTAAIADDCDATKLHAAPGAASSTSSRAQRIAAAVQRSKLEYQPVNVYTERQVRVYVDHLLITVVPI